MISSGLVPTTHNREEMNAMVAQAGAIPGTGGDGGGIQSLLQDLTSSIPGIDEIISFAELMKQV